jgi:hypothetical protein
MPPSVRREPADLLRMSAPQKSLWWRVPGLGRVSAIGIDAPRPEPGRHGLAIALIVRNEERHIREWAAFHALAGVRHFLVYDNGCTDATLPILRETLRDDALTVVPWRQRLRDVSLGREIHNQVLAYAHAASNFGSAFRWMGFIDVDEFLVPRRERSLPEALAHLEPNCVNVSLPWHMFGRSGFQTPPAGGVLRNYLRRAADPMSDLRGVRAFKCLVDPCRLTALKVHSMQTDGNDRTCNDRGVEVPLRRREEAKFYSADHVQLNHYYSRSEQEVVEKFRRGPNLVAKASEYERKVRRTIANIERHEVEDHSAIDYLGRMGRAAHWPD